MSVLLPLPSREAAPNRKPLHALFVELKRKAHCYIALSACVAAVLCSTGCGVVSRTKQLFGGTLPIQVTVAANVNQESPVAVDLLVVYNKKLLDKMFEIPASDWFAGGRDQFQRDYPKAFQLHSWEWIPGQRVELEPIRIKSGAKAGIIFADYFSDGAHRARFDPRKPLRIELKEDGFKVGETES